MEKQAKNLDFKSKNTACSLLDPGSELL